MKHYKTLYSFIYVMYKTLLYCMQHSFWVVKCVAAKSWSVSPTLATINVVNSSKTRDGMRIE